MLALMVITAGCAGFTGSPSTDSQSTTQSPGDTSATTSASTSASTTTTQTSTSESVADAKQRAMSAEKERIKQQFDSSNTSVTVGVYGQTTATVVNQSETGILVRVTMSYSYEYSCNNESGAADGLTTKVVYQVTSSNTSIVEIDEDVQNICAATETAAAGKTTDD